jgi:hypothetical protein
MNASLLAGSVIGVSASLMTTLISSWIAHRREVLTRWDPMLLSQLTDAIVDNMRVNGNLYAWARGDVTVDGRNETGLSPRKIADALDRSHYSLLKLALLLPNVRDKIEALQALSAQRRAEVSRRWADHEGLPADQPDFLEFETTLRDQSKLLLEEIRDAGQEALRIPQRRTPSRRPVA